MKHAYSKSAPTGRIETDKNGNYLAPFEYADHGATQVSTICDKMDSNTQRLQRITDSIIDIIITRIKA